MTDQIHTLAQGSCEPSPKEIGEAYSDWAWNKEGEPVGYMLPHDAARIAFFAGARWRAKSALAAQPPAAPVETEDAIELVSQIIYQEASISHYGDESEVDNSDYVAREVLRALARKHHSPCSAETGEVK